MHGGLPAVRADGRDGDAEERLFGQIKSQRVVRVGGELVCERAYDSSAILVGGEGDGAFAGGDALYLSGGTDHLPVDIVEESVFHGHD